MGDSLVASKTVQYVILELKVFRTGSEEGKEDGPMGAHEQELEFKMA